ncbi:MAG TPA: Na+/H+ antiporter NhaC [Bacteroidetes bacterium]|nr:Na+/H+ antiporter NhaC [Bacteroidota bacterium]
MKLKKREPSLFIALLPLAAIALFLGVGYGVFHIQSESLLVSAAFVTGIIAAGLGYSWKEMEEGIVASIGKAMPAMLIVITVGILIGSWIACGTIPMMIYYGIKLISPKYFLVTASIVCSLVSLFTGTSWGTVGTIGVAFIGVAKGLGIPVAPAAGAIVAGAYFGDKLSPFSDTTNLAPIVARSNLFDHIRHLLWTTTPAWLIGLVLYFFIGLKYRPESLDSSQMDLILNTISVHFNFNVLLLLPMVIVLYYAVRKKPTIPGMLIASFTAMLLGLIFQGSSVAESLGAMAVGYKSQTGVAVVDNLISRGGMAGMMHVTLIAFCAFAFAGIAQSSGMLDVILKHLLRVAKTPGKLIAATVGSGIAIALMTGSSFLSILVPGELYAPAFKKMNLAAKNLSRTTEDSGTVIVPLVPWSMAGVFMAGTLNVPTLTYLPFTFMCYLGFVFALIYGFTGFAIAPCIREDETVPGS